MRRRVKPESWKKSTEVIKQRQTHTQDNPKCEELTKNENYIFLRAQALSCVVRILDEKTDAFALGSIGITIKAFFVINEAIATLGTCKRPGAAIFGKPVEN
jgi:hypothetical protein